MKLLVVRDQAVQEGRGGAFEIMLFISKASQLHHSIEAVAWEVSAGQNPAPCHLWDSSSSHVTAKTASW